MDEKMCCDTCGLPIAECNALTIGRNEAERWLQMEGYKPGDARRVAYELIPEPTPSKERNDGR